jgi:hypothetical protein
MRQWNLHQLCPKQYRNKKQNHQRKRLKMDFAYLVSMKMLSEDSDLWVQYRDKYDVVHTESFDMVDLIESGTDFNTILKDILADSGTTQINLHIAVRGR